MGKVITDLFTNYVLMSAVFGWIIAQILKVFTGVFKLQKFTVTSMLFGTGGMPSSHTAAVVGTCSASAIVYGLGSFQFAVTGLLSMIVIRDAMGVRREVGEQAKALNQILEELFKGQTRAENEKSLKELVGHTPLQVFFGALTGVAVPFVLYLIPVFRASAIALRGGI